VPRADYASVAVAALATTGRLASLRRQADAEADRKPETDTCGTGPGHAARSGLASVGDPPPGWRSERAERVAVGQVPFYFAANEGWLPVSRARLNLPALCVRATATGAGCPPSGLGLSHVARASRRAAMRLALSGDQEEAAIKQFWVYLVQRRKRIRVRAHEDLVRLAR